MNQNRAPGRRSQLPALTLVLALAALAWPLAGVAAAQTKCEYSAGGESLSVTMDTEMDEATLGIKVAAIQVGDSGGLLACSGGAATLSNTKTIIVGTTGGADDTTLALGSAERFALHLTIVDNPGSGSGGRLLLGELIGAGTHRFGQSGVDVDGDGDGDIVFFGSAPDSISASSGEVAFGMHFDGRGGIAIGGPVGPGTGLELLGGEGDDSLIGGEGPDQLAGMGGDDTIEGGGSSDIVMPDSADAGDDTVDGGPGSDGLSYLQATGPLHVDLSRQGPQATGQGTDTISGFETLLGGSGDDTLIGNDSPNVILGVGGADTIEGRGGLEDFLDGGEDGEENIVSYASSPAGVTVHLDNEPPYAEDAEGADIVKDFADVIGSSHADLLFGDGAANELLGGAGHDQVAAGAGDDTVEVRDGEGDSASCGAGSDRATSDQRSLDQIDADCETINALPEPPPTPPGTGANVGGPPTPTLAHCVVPHLTGRTLKADRRKLRQAGCRLGNVHGPKKGSDKVHKQSAKPGTTLPAASKITVRTSDGRV